MVIVCATDFSPARERVFDAAIEIADRFGCERLMVVQVHAIHQRYERVETLVDAGDALSGETELSAQRALRRVRAAGGGARVTVETASLRGGDVADAVRRFAREAGAHLLVVGAPRARSRLRAWLRPSCVTAILEGAPCPVLVVDVS
jgi:nucleotide-binding universal stress UspA family protein